MAKKTRSASAADRVFECLRSTPASLPDQPAIYHQLTKTWGRPEDGLFDHTSVHVAVLREPGEEAKPLGFASLIWVYAVQGAVEIERPGADPVLLNDANPQFERKPAKDGLRVRAIETPAVLILFCSDDPGGPIKTPPPKNPN